MCKYRKKPVVIEAIQYTRDNIHEVMNFIEEYSKEDNSRYLLTKSDYIICGVKGEFYPCKPDIFEMTYEKVEEWLYSTYYIWFDRWRKDYIWYVE